MHQNTRILRFTCLVLFQNKAILICRNELLKYLPIFKGLCEEDKDSKVYIARVINDNFTTLEGFRRIKGQNKTEMGMRTASKAHLNLS